MRTTLYNLDGHSVSLSLPFLYDGKETRYILDGLIEIKFNTGENGYSESIYGWEIEEKILFLNYEDDFEFLLHTKNIDNQNDVLLNHIRDYIVKQIDNQVIDEIENDILNDDNESQNADYPMGRKYA